MTQINAIRWCMIGILFLNQPGDTRAKVFKYCKLGSSPSKRLNFGNSKAWQPVFTPQALSIIKSWCWFNEFEGTGVAYGAGARGVSGSWEENKPDVYQRTELSGNSLQLQLAKHKPAVAARPKLIEGEYDEYRRGTKKHFRDPPQEHIWYVSIQG